MIASRGGVRRQHPARPRGREAARLLTEWLSVGDDKHLEKEYRRSQRKGEARVVSFTDDSFPLAGERGGRGRVETYVGGHQNDFKIPEKAQDC